VAGPDPARRPPRADPGAFLGTFALIFFAMGALFALDTLLARMEAGERRSEARQLYQEGVELTTGRRYPAAVDRFQGAVSAERTNPLYQRALAAALLASGKVTDARTVLADRLQREPTDAAASFLMAHVLEREGEDESAASYYHRAIYGHWDQDAARNRVGARFDLIDLLARTGNQRELLAELLPLQDEAPSDVATRRRIARLFVDAGSPPRAIEIYRDLLRRDGRDAETWAGLAEAEFARGNYRSARADFATAVRLAPGDSAIAGRLRNTERVLALDPTQRGLSSKEQASRSVGLLELTLAAADSCLATAADTSARLLADSARALVSAKPPAAGLHAAMETNLDLAERLWAERGRICPGQRRPGEQVLGLVLDKVAQ